MSKKIVQLVVAAAVLFTSGYRAGAQGMAINTTGAAANGSAILDVSSTSQGMLLPRMTSAQRTGIASPTAGLIVYQTDGTAGFYYYTGSAWVSLNSSTTAAGGDLTGTYPNPTIAGGAVTPAKMSTSSGTAGSGTFYRGDGAWSQVNLGSNVTGNLLVTNLNSGTGANGTTFWRGDGTWAAPTGGSGTVTSVSSGNLSPIFTSSVSNATTTPAISYTLSSTSGYTTLTNSTNATAAVSYGAIVPQALSASSGTPSSSTFYRGDGTWQSLSAGGTVIVGMTAEPSVSTYYASFIGPGSLATNLYGTPMPVNLTFTKMYITGIVRTAAIGGTDLNTVTLYKNGSATALTANFTTGASDAVLTQYSVNVAATVSCVAGDVLAIRVDQSNVATGAVCNIGISFLAN